MALIYSSDKNTATVQGFDASQHKHSLELLPLSLYPCLAELHKSWCGDVSHLFDDLCCGHQSKAVVVNPDSKQLSVVHIRDGDMVNNHFRMRKAKPAEWEMIERAMEVLDNERPIRTHFPSSEHPQLLADLKTSLYGMGSQICGRSDCVEVWGGVITNAKAKEVTLHHSCDGSVVRNHHKMTTTKLTAWQVVEQAMDERYGRKLSELGKKLGGNGNVYFGRCGPAARPVNMLRSLSITVRGMEQEKKHGGVEQTVNYPGIYEPRFELGSTAPELHKDISSTPKTMHQSHFPVFPLLPLREPRGFFAPHTATRPGLVMENQPQHHSQHNKPGLQQPVSARSPQPASQYQNVFEFRFPSGRDSLQSHTGLRSSPNSSTEANNSENEVMNETKDVSDAKPARKWITTYKIDFNQAKQRLRDSEYGAVAEKFNSPDRSRGPLHLEYFKRSETPSLSTLCGCISYPSCPHTRPLESPPYQQPTPVQSTGISVQSHTSNPLLSEGATSDSDDEYETDSEPEIITSRPASPKPDSRGPIQREDGEWDLMSDVAQDSSYHGSSSSGSSESDFVEITNVLADSPTGM